MKPRKYPYSGVKKRDQKKLRTANSRSSNKNRGD